MFPGVQSLLGLAVQLQAQVLPSLRLSSPPVKGKPVAS